MEQTERLLDLIALFLDAREPVSWAELRDSFPYDYGQGARESCERKFERDKAELADLGISLKWQAPCEDSAGGYLLDREDYYLPKIAFSPEETAVLYTAGSAALAAGAFPGRTDLAHALRKIAFASAEDPPSISPRFFVDHGPSSSSMARRLETLWHALVSRKRVTLRYRGAGREEETERAVDPWGLCLRRGVWVLVGFCHLRQARRTFHVDRISEIRLNPLRPRSPDYDLPAQFDISDVAREQVWEHPFHDPVEVVLSLDAELAPMAERLFPNSRVQSCDSGARVIIAARYLDGLLRQVLSLGEGARVVSPERAVERLREMLDAIQSDALPEEHTA